MSVAPALESHRTTLMHLTEMTSGVLRVAYARTLAAEGAAFYAAVEAFSDLGRGVRLSIALDLRLMAFARVADQPVRLRAEAAPSLEQPERSDPPEPRERERDVERDSFPMDPLGRVCVLERIITRTPALDPDRRVSAEIIELKAFLEGPTPPPEPSGPPVSKPTPNLNRPPNRAERRRMRRASG